MGLGGRGAVTRGAPGTRREAKVGAGHKPNGRVLMSRQGGAHCREGGGA